MCFNVYLHNLQFVMAIVSIYLHKHFVVREHFHVDLQSVRLVRVEFALSRFIEARASFHVDHQHRQKQANIHACIHTSMQTYIHIYIYKCTCRWTCAFFEPLQNHGSAKNLRFEMLMNIARHLPLLFSCVWKIKVSLDYYLQHPSTQRIRLFLFVC